MHVYTYTQVTHSTDRHTYTRQLRRSRKVVWTMVLTTVPSSAVILFYFTRFATHCTGESEQYTHT